ncbi:hypothetical protein DES36_11554 [Alkalibaculum bacchi]|uniref:Uncharacterized protein n=1 Tax=Alkalibaculum bacchi TaxID=645887 RepID=A0A366I3D8_9FIRM|nr:hypothetical protein [Alkalibaculum bacchi]RBP61055.1 hypothetical protein DES36_11554 [Alkalibaculum bacchi]
MLTHFGTALDNPIEYTQNAVDVFHNTIIGFDGFTGELSFEKN